MSPSTSSAASRKLMVPSRLDVSIPSQSVAMRTELDLRREHDCRLVPERALETIDDARAFLDDRGLLTLTADCALPSLFGACHEEPYSNAPGFGQWPKTKYWWPSAWGALSTRLHRGKTLFVSDAVAARIGARCLEELARAEEGVYGGEAAAVVRHLAEAGPSLLEELREEVALDRRVRERLERVGAIVWRGVRLEEPHRHTSELRRWDQAFASPEPVEDPVRELLVAGVRAAVVAAEREALRWFSWPVPAEALDDERLLRPEPGWVAAA